MATDRTTLERLRRQVAALENGAAAGTDKGHRAISFGLAAVDACLPANGLAHGCIHEIVDGSGLDIANGSATAFAAALAGRAQRLHRPPVVWIAPRDPRRESLYAPGLTVFGLDPAALIVVRIPGNGRSGAARALWAMEEALRTPAVGAVCAEIDAVDLTASRRLQLAAEAGGALGLLLRGPTSSAAAPIASATRWRITAAPSAPATPSSLPGMPRWQVALLRARGGTPDHWLLEWRHDPDRGTAPGTGHGTAGGFALAAPLGDRPARPAAPGTGAPPGRFGPRAQPLADTG